MEAGSLRNGQAPSDTHSGDFSRFAAQQAPEKRAHNQYFCRRSSFFERGMCLRGSGETRAAERPGNALAILRSSISWTPASKAR
eukprot:9057045-Pyramimonas_sp.AAC.1